MISGKSIGWLVALLIIQASLKLQEEKKDVRELYNNPDHEIYAGFIYPREGESSMLFYEIFSARGKFLSTTTIPLIIWLEGGPGCSGVFSGHSRFGPFNIKNSSAGKGAFERNTEA